MSLHSSFTTASIPDQTGRLAIVTGGNSGIGLEAARALAVAGADVILATRSAEKGEAAVADIRRSAPGATVSREALDLSDLASVAAFSEGRRRDGRPINLLVNNAGIMAIPQRQVTADGFEMQLGTNFLGHFALTAQLLELVRAAPTPRVVTVSSTAADMGRIWLDDLQLESGYSAWKAYGQSKLATSILFVELDRRSRAGGWGIVSTGAHPGLSRTNLQTTGPMQGKSGFNPVHFFGQVPFISQSSAGGALPTLRAATDPAAESGAYYGPRRITAGAPVKARITPRAKDRTVGEALIARAEALTETSWPTASATSTT